MAWLNELWDKLHNNAAFWTIVGFIISGSVQYVFSSRLAKRNFAYSQIIAKAARDDAALIRREGLENQGVLQFIQAMTELRLLTQRVGDRATNDVIKWHVRRKYLVDHSERYTANLESFYLALVLLPRPHLRALAAIIGEKTQDFWNTLIDAILTAEVDEATLRAEWKEIADLYAQLSNECRRELYGDDAIPDTH